MPNANYRIAMLFGMAVAAVSVTSGARAETYTVRNRQPACVSRDTWVRVFELIDSRDNTAADKLFDEMISKGECRVFMPGDVAVIETSEWRTKLAKVHLEDDPRPYWIMLMSK